MKRTKITITTFLFLFVAVAYAKQTATLSDVQEFLSGKPTNQQVSEYIENLKEAIKYDPEEYLNYEMLAFCYDYLGQYDRAAVITSQAIKHFPAGEDGLDALYGNLARQYLSLDNLGDAKQAIDKALGFNPKNTINHQHLLDYYLRKGDYKEAAVELKTIHELTKGGEQDYYYDTYVLALKRGIKQEDLVFFFREAVNVNPNCHLAHRALATALRGVTFEDIDKKFPLIMEELNKAWELNPKHIPTYISIANMYMFMGMKTGDKRYFKDTLRWFLKARKLEPKNYRLAYAMGNFFMNTEQYDKAIAKFEYIVQIGAHDNQVIEMLARAYNGKAYNIYKSGKKLKEGLMTIDKALNLRPNDGIFLSTKAELLYKLGRLNEAYDYIKKAIVLKPDEPEIKQDLENIEKAIKELNQKE